MATDVSIPRTRRALLAGGIGGAAALVASALGRPLPVSAGSDGDVVLGAGNTATTTTAISNFTTADTAFAANCSKGTAVSGTTSAIGWAGVYGVSNTLGAAGVFGRNKASLAVGKLGHGRSGVDGSCDAGWGVVGATMTGTGLYGYALTGTAGYFVSGEAKKGYALRADGRVRFDKCAGVATIAAGSDRVTVTPGINLVSTSAVVATLQGNAGATSTSVSRCIANATTDTFTVILTKAATANVKVAWIVLG